MLPASDQEILDRVGHPPFAITPIGVDLPTVIDEALMDQATILTGAGTSRMEIELAPDDLRRLSNAVIACIQVDPS